MKNTIQNAKIDGFNILIDEFGTLTINLILDYGNMLQMFGGHALYLPFGFKNHAKQSVFGHFLFKILELTDSKNINEIVGKTIRVHSGYSEVSGIGHIIKDLWFYPNKDLT